jgi:malate/lactate dehydrogenase
MTSVTVIGCGAVGSQIAYGCILHPKLSVLQLRLVDIDEKRLNAEVADLKQAAEILHNYFVQVEATSEIKESDIFVIAAGRSSDDRESLYEFNKPIVENYMAKISKVCHERSMVIMVTNPSTQLAQLALNYIPFVIPAGSMLDNARWRLCKVAGSHEKPNIQQKYHEVKDGKGHTAFAPATEAINLILRWCEGFK